MKRAIVRWYDKHEVELADLTRSRARDYALRCNAAFVEYAGDFVGIDKQQMRNKYRCSELLSVYDEICWIDCDVLPMTDENIFAAASACKSLAAVNEWPVVRTFNPKSITHYLNAYKKIGKDIEYAYRAGQGVVNGGVMVVKSRDAYRDPRTQAERWDWLEDQLVATRDCDLWLPDAWNWLYIRRDFWKGVKLAKFIHANGARGRYRLELINALLDGDFTRRDPPKGDWRPDHGWKRR